MVMVPVGMGPGLVTSGSHPGLISSLHCKTREKPQGRTQNRPQAAVLSRHLPTGAQKCADFTDHYHQQRANGQKKRAE